MQPDRPRLVESKSPFRSRTYAGLALVAVVAIARLCGIELDDEESQQVVDGITLIVGVLIAAYGRQNATAKLSFNHEGTKGTKEADQSYDRWRRAKTYKSSLLPFAIFAPFAAILFSGCSTLSGVSAGVTTDGKAITGGNIAFKFHGKQRQSLLPRKGARDAKGKLE